MATTTESIDRSEIIATRSGCDVGWPPLECGRISLYPAETYLADGRIKIQFHPEDSHKPVYRPEAPWIGIRHAMRGESGLRVTGLWTPPAQRGKGIGRDMLRWLIDGSEARGMPLVGTGRINKPMTALILEREGFVPSSDRSVAEIVSPGDEDGVPAIRWLHNIRGNRTIIDGSTYYGPFYTLEGPATVEDFIPPQNPHNVVHLHTTFDR